MYWEFKVCLSGSENSYIVSLEKYVLNRPEILDNQSGKLVKCHVYIRISDTQYMLVGKNE